MENYRKKTVIHPGFILAIWLFSFSVLITFIDDAWHAFNWSYVLPLVLVVVNIINNKRNKKTRECAWKSGGIIDETFRAYEKIMQANYEVKPCEGCGKSEMRLLAISPTGKSYFCECTYCNKKQTRMFISGDDNDLIQVHETWNNLPGFLGADTIDLVFELERESVQNHSQKRRTISE